MVITRGVLAIGLNEVGVGEGNRQFGNLSLVFREFCRIRSRQRIFVYQSALTVTNAMYG